MLWFRRPDALVPTLSLLGYLLLAYPMAGADGVSFLVGV
jgi:hypothetical protein